MFAVTDTTIATSALVTTVVPPTVKVTSRAGTAAGPRFSILLSNSMTTSVPDVDRLALNLADNLPDESSLIGTR